MLIVLHADHADFSDDDDCLILGEDYVIGEGAQIHSANITLMHNKQASGKSAKCLGENSCFMR